MENKIDYKTLLAFSEGKYSYKQYQNIKHWFMNVRDDEQTEAQLLNQWKEAGSSSTPGSLNAVFEKIHYQILLEEKKGKRKINFWHSYRQVAAILIPIFIVSTFTYFVLKSEQTLTPNWVEINVPEGARIEFMLPDSSTGWLNSGAKLKYPAVFSSHRNVELIGEAFFKVKHKENSDFTVRVSDIDIRVLGTEFNVSAYSNEENTEVVLNEGKVEINGKTAKFKQILQPGDKIAFNHLTKTVDLTKVDPAVYLAWKDGYLIIDNDPMEQAVKKIGRWYNTDIVIKDDVLKTFRFKATFADEPLEEVLRLIAMTTPIKYEIKKRNTDSNGIITKRQVKIMLKN